MKKILVTGSLGQLGRCLQDISKQYYDFDFIFVDLEDFDICNENEVASFFQKNKPDYCINTAAFTAVDLAESQQEKAFQVNADGTKNLAISCSKFNTVLIHISTDFVFDGQKKTPYTEDDIANPINVYGKSKREGEKHIQEIWFKHFIIRTSWLYSLYGNNFLKTMLRLAETKKELSIVNDQIGTPTNASDLAEAIMLIISKHTMYEQRHQAIDFYGIFHYSNEGQCSWFDFARKIFEINAKDIVLRPIATSNYHTPARRPKYSVLDKSKIKKQLRITVRSWDESLKDISIRM